MKRTEEELRQQVGFSDEQLKQYEALRISYGDSIDRQLSALRNLRSEFMKLVYKNADTVAIANSTGKICAAQMAVDQLVLRHFIKFRRLAKDDQSEKMDSFLKTVTKSILAKHTSHNRNK
jgi:hypothetical protein